MNIELYIIKLFFKYSLYIKYKDYLDSNFIKDNSKELYKILQAVNLYHQQFPEKDIDSVETFQVFYFTNYPASSKKERDELDPLFKKLQEAIPDEAVVSSYLTTHRDRAEACSLAIEALEVSDGKKDPQAFWDKVFAMKEARKEVAGPEESEFVDDNLEGLQERLTEGGFYWRNKWLNKALGPLRRGDFGFVFARPETGKTTFLASEITFMAEQVADERPIIWFNNEEQGEKVVIRCYQACLGITTPELFKNLAKNKEIYAERTKATIKVFDSGSLHKRDIDRVCNKYNPCLIIVDQIDKVKGFQDDRNDLQLKEIYQWARELAKKFGPVVAVCQAGGTAEGKKYLTMDDVDSSKTAKQGEADWILGIGKTHNEGMDSIRHFSLCKNKLFGDKDSIPELRHGKCDVRILPEVGRYQDL